MCNVVIVISGRIIKKASYSSNARNGKEDLSFFEIMLDQWTHHCNYATLQGGRT